MGNVSYYSDSCLLYSDFSLANTPEGFCKSLICTVEIEIAIAIGVKFPLVLSIPIPPPTPMVPSPK